MNFSLALVAIAFALVFFGAGPISLDSIRGAVEDPSPRELHNMGPAAISMEQAFKTVIVPMD